MPGRERKISHSTCWYSLSLMKPLVDFSVGTLQPICGSECNVMCKAALEFHGKCKISKLLSKSNQTENGSPSSLFNHEMFPLVPIKTGSGSLYAWFINEKPHLQQRKQCNGAAAIISSLPYKDPWPAKYWPLTTDKLPSIWPMAVCTQGTVDSDDNGEILPNISGSMITWNQMWPWL